jgi:uncharacterized protein (DUF111 family)
MLYLDCFSGASGDMILGALIDLGLPVDALKGALGSLAIEYGDISAGRVMRAGISSTKFPLHPPRAVRSRRGFGGTSSPQALPLEGIVNAIRRSHLKPEGQDRAIQLFGRLAEAEAAIHETPIEKVHLHEVGALDSDHRHRRRGLRVRLLRHRRHRLVAAQRRRRHGALRARRVCRAGAGDARLLKGVPVYSKGTSEMLTPTGALLVTGYAKAFGPLPPMRIEQIGYGAGDRDPKGTPNVLRIMKGERAEAIAPTRRNASSRSSARSTT